jgi:hypothetical protein
MLNKRIFRIIFASGLSIALVGMAAADLDQGLTEAGWDEIIFDELPPNQYTAIIDTDGQVQGIRLVSHGTVSVAFLNIERDLNETPKLTWQWRVDTPPIDTDVTRKGGDDRSLSIYVAFPYQSEHASFGEKLKRTAVEALRGADTPGRVLNYVWGGGAEKGSFVVNPYTGKYGMFIFQRSPKDESGLWLTETVNLRADFIKAFGYEPAAPVYVGIGADSDDTDTRIEAQIRNIEFVE